MYTYILPVFAARMMISKKKDSSPTSSNWNRLADKTFLLSAFI